MKTTMFFVAAFSAFAVSGCGRESGAPVAKPSPSPAESAFPATLPLQTNEVINVGTIHVDGGVRHVSHETILLEAELGEDVSRLIQPDMTLIDDRNRE